MRAFVVGLLLLLSGCDFGYGVSRRIRPPFAFQAEALRVAIEAMPGAKQEIASEREGFLFTFGDSERGPWVWLFQQPRQLGGYIEATTMWINQAPDYSFLRACIALQEDVLRHLERSVPGFPSLGSLPLEWDGLSAPLGDRWTSLREVHEAEFGK